jgi:glycosyltransferase involved in cell wall biosynthesis
MLATHPQTRATVPGLNEPLSYAVITPARNEAGNLSRLAHCLEQQAVPPSVWVVVDDGSTDDTAAIVAAFAARHKWVRLIDSPRARHDEHLSDGRRGGRDVTAFVAGIEAVRPARDVVIKLDADVSIEADFFDRLLREFQCDPALGIAGGTCYEFHGGRWRAQSVTAGHVRGATKAYRWSCYQQIAPLEEQLGWDGLDELKAETLGWSSRSVRDLPFLHHRAVGSRDGRRRAWVLQGEAAHFMGYRAYYVVLRSLRYFGRDAAALCMVWGYAAAALRRQPQHADPAVRAVLRDRQRLRSLPARAREALDRFGDTPAPNQGPQDQPHA